METTFDCLPRDVLLIIVANFILASDNLSVRQICVGFWKACPFMSFKILSMTDKIDTVCHLNTESCINANCYWRCIQTVAVGRYLDECKRFCLRLGTTTFYYPEELMEPHDYEGDPYGPNFEYPHRLRACRDSKCVKRYIPYCQRCTIDFVNFGMRDDDLEIPFDTVNGINNL